MRAMNDQSQWLELGSIGGQQCYSRVCVVKGDKFAYNGLGFVQYKDPRCLVAAWNYNHLRSSRVRAVLEEMGVAPNQEGFIKRMGKRSCVLEP
eukprot:10629188-Karenia_brevis.AAC.1